MKEPSFFKDVVYPPGILLKENANAFTEWSALCTGAATGSSEPGSLEIVGREDTEQEYVLFQNLPADAKAASRILVRLERNARVRLIVIQDGADTSHIEIEALCVGDGAEIELRGLQNTKGKQKHSIRAMVKHQKSHTKSDMKVWCVGRDQGHSIFNGLIDIQAGAKHCEAYQRNKNLMLSSKATMDTFPKLFIANDEVKAAHGASISTLEVEQLAYLQSRGISREDAESMVTRGFIHQVVDDIRNPKLKKQTEEKLGLQEYLSEGLGWES